MKAGRKKRKKGGGKKGESFSEAAPRAYKGHKVI
jgi:hypothetical protein